MNRSMHVLNDITEPRYLWCVDSGAGLSSLSRSTRPEPIATRPPGRSPWSERTGSSCIQKLLHIRWRTTSGSRKMQLPVCQWRELQRELQDKENGVIRTQLHGSTYLFTSKTGCCMSKKKIVDTGLLRSMSMYSWGYQAFFHWNLKYAYMYNISKKKIMNLTKRDDNYRSGGGGGSHNLKRSLYKKKYKTRIIIAIRFFSKTENTF